MDKSSLLILGCAENESVPDWVANSGFKVENELLILGCKITKNVPSWHVNFDKTIATVCKIKNFWERFQLSLPGRVGIAKSLMLSQISYLGCFLTPTKKQFNDLNSLITSFIKGNLNISKEKFFLSPEDGGIGMIASEPYVCSLQCGWFKRIFNGAPDSYKEILGVDNDLALDPVGCSPTSWPILAGIWASFGKFYGKFASINNNWKKMPLLYHPLLKQTRNVRGGGAEGTVISARFFAHNIPPISKADAKTFLAGNVWCNGNLNNLEVIKTGTAAQLSLASYMRLSASVVYWEKKH
jgi:hypothetical protein